MAKDPSNKLHIIMRFQSHSTAYCALLPQLLDRSTEKASFSITRPVPLGYDYKSLPPPTSVRWPKSPVDESVGCPVLQP